MKKKAKPTFRDSYPNLADFVDTQGTLEIGEDPNVDSFVRLIDAGGELWSDDGDLCLEEALAAAEAFCGAHYG